MSNPPALPARAPPRSPTTLPASAVQRKAPPTVMSRWPPANVQSEPPIPQSRIPKQRTIMEKPEPPPSLARPPQRAKSVVEKPDSPASLMSGRPLPNPMEPDRERPLPKPVVVEKERPLPKSVMVEKENSTSMKMPRVTPERSTLANGDINHDSFGASLHNSHEALAKKHEDELIALESLRFHIFNRAKQDKSYAEELFRTNQRASKKAGNVSNPTSPIFQVRLEFCFFM